MSFPKFTAEASIGNHESYVDAKGKYKKYDSSLKIEPAVPPRWIESYCFYTGCEEEGGIVSPRYKRCRRKICTYTYANGASRMENIVGNWWFPLHTP